MVDRGWRDWVEWRKEWLEEWRKERRKDAFSRAEVLIATQLVFATRAKFPRVVE
jgi:hypothetical protein